MAGEPTAQGSEKLEVLRRVLSSLQSVLVAYSGGVDSTFLLRLARDLLGERAQAATVSSELSPWAELEQARQTARALGVEPIVVQVSMLDDPEIAANPPERCYLCKRRLFTLLRHLAEKRGLAHVVDGSNRDDLAEHRPGRRALAELGIRSPLQEAGLSKAEIRSVSRQIGLPTWNRPAMACLATRFPYGTALEAQDLERVDKAEAFLEELGVGQRRVRHHGRIARLEIDPADWPLVLGKRQRIVDRLRELGYAYVTVDLAGFRSGSMDEVL